jgi:hypothetical protein
MVGAIPLLPLYAFKVRTRIILHGKSSYQQEEDNFHKQEGLKCKGKTSKILHFELKIDHLGNYIRNTWEVLKCGAGEGRSIGPIM